MSNKLTNQVMMAVMDRLAQEAGRTDLVLKFEDFDLPDDCEPLFDGACLWALHEGLLTVTSSEHLEDACTELSYAVLHGPAVTSLGIAVATFAMKKLDGNMMLAAAMVKNPILVSQVGSTAA